MTQEAITSKNAPAPVGPYSPAIAWKDLIFISGQGPLDPATGRFVEGDIAQQTRQVFANLDALLLASGSSRSQVLKVQVYLAHIEDFQAMNAVYKEFFQGVTFPARTTIEAGALPLGISVEIDMIAYRPPSAG
jgi:2-iminobutanoate/2-iminopropanoate deaminase